MMEFNFGVQTDVAYVSLPGGVISWLVFVLALLPLAYLLITDLRSIRKLTFQQSVRWLLSIVLVALLANRFLFKLNLEDAAFLPATPHWASLLIGLPVILAATVGIAPAIIVGAAAGLVRALWISHSLVDVITMTSWAVVAGYLLCQKYEGLLPRLMRQPLVAAVVSSIAIWLAEWLGLLIYPTGKLLESFIRDSLVLAAEIPVILIFSVVGGLLAQIVVTVLRFVDVPERQPIRRPTGVRGRLSSPRGTLKVRALFAVFPILAILSFVLFYTVNSTVVDVAVKQTVSQAESTTAHVAQRFDDFYQSTNRLLSEIARQESFWINNPIGVEYRLKEYLDAAPSLQRVALLNSVYQPLSAWPEAPSSFDYLTAIRYKVADAARLTARVSWSAPFMEEGRLLVSIAAPIVDGSGFISGYVLGDCSILNVPAVSSLEPVGADRKDWIGFMVDSSDTIIAHPDGVRLLQKWQRGTVDRELASTASGRAQIEVDEAGGKWIVFQSVPNKLGWRAVTVLPYETIIDIASRISRPLVAVLALIGAIVTGLIVILVGRFVRPLESLSSAAEKIANGDLETPVAIRGDDEIGRLGMAFEKMRLSLRRRIHDLALLLRISRTVAAHPNLTDSFLPILNGALKGTPAVCARIVMLNPDGSPESEFVKDYAADEARWRKESDFSGQFVKLLGNGQPFRVTQPAQYGSLFGRGVESVLSFPVFVNKQISAALLVEFDRSDAYDSSDVEFAATLAGQIGVAIQTARLFEAVELERQRLASVLSSAADGILVTDRTNRVILFNDACLRILHLTQEEALGQDLLKLRVMTNLKNAFTDIVNGDGAVVRKGHTANGGLVYASGAPMLSQDGDLDGRVIVVRDVTSVEATDQGPMLIRTLAHELRSPLTTVHGYTRMIENAGALSKSQGEHVEKIRAGIGRMSELLDALVNLARVETGQEIETKDLHLEAVLAAVVDEMREAVRAKGLEARAQWPEAPLPTIQGDPALLKMAIRNIVDNAIKYTSNGRILLQAGISEGWVFVSIQDSGPGIPQDHLPHIFEKFYRVKSPDTVRVPGSGLGLALVKAVAKAHGGHTWAVSEVDRGTRVFFAVPAAENESAGTVAPRPENVVS